MQRSDLVCVWFTSFVSIFFFPIAGSSDLAYKAFDDVVKVIGLSCCPTGNTVLSNLWHSLLLSVTTNPTESPFFAVSNLGSANAVSVLCCCCVKFRSPSPSYLHTSIVNTKEERVGEEYKGNMLRLKWTVISWLLGWHLKDQKGASRSCWFKSGVQLLSW